MKIKALKNTTKTLKNLSDDQMLVGVLVIVSVIYVTLVVKSDNSNDRLLNFYSSPSGILFGTLLIVVALAVNHASIKKMVPILGKYSKKTAILSGFVVFFNIFSLIYAGKVREDLLIPSGGELKYVDDEDGRVVKKKFQFTNADDVDFDDGESGDSGGGSDRYGGIYEDMNKSDLKEAKNLLKEEDKKKNKDEIRYISDLVSAIREGFENYVNGENEDEDLNVVEKKLSNSCRKVVVDPDTTNISGADLGGDLFDLADFEKKVLV